MVREGARERLQFIRPASLPGTEVLAVYESSRRWNLFHERYAFVVARKAATTVRYRGVEQRIQDGSLVVREPGEASCCTAVAKPAELKVLFVEPSLVADAAREVGHTGILHFAPVPISDPDLFWLLCRLCSSIEDGDNGLEQQTLFAMCMVKLAQHAERPPRATESRNGKLAVARAKAYLSEHCSEPVSLHDLALVAGFSRFGLVHAFTKEVGLSPHAYQVHVRIERARALLQHGVSPATVATTVGFADQSHFTRHFRRILQVTPSQYAGRSIAWQSRAGAFGSLSRGRHVDEDALVSAIEANGDRVQGVLISPTLSQQPRALDDALKTMRVPVVEVLRPYAIALRSVVEMLRHPDA